MRLAYCILNLLPVRRYDAEAPAGYGSLTGAETGSGHCALTANGPGGAGSIPGKLSVIAVSGDSMAPELSGSDLIRISRAQATPRDGFMYVVRCPESMFVKRVHMVPEHKVELLSTNPYDTPVIVDLPQNSAARDTDPAFIGRVVASMHEWQTFPQKEISGRKRKSVPRNMVQTARQSHVTCSALLIDN